MELILEDYEKINNDAFEGTFYYGDNMVIAQISTDWLIDYEENNFQINAVVLSAQQYDDNDKQMELTITNKEIENFVENDMHEWFDDYLKKIA
tara:strand:+ start:78 stop:356 length:279 start_codon:yes stop_codon:yes gene_type:complete